MMALCAAAKLRKNNTDDAYGAVRNDVISLDDQVREENLIDLEDDMRNLHYADIRNMNETAECKEQINGEAADDDCVTKKLTCPVTSCSFTTWDWSIRINYLVLRKINFFF